MSFKVPEKYRIANGPYGSDERAGNNGAFKIPCDAGGHKKLVLRVIASDGEGWEHVSVSPVNAQRTPFWEEMSYIKNLFWDSEDCVVEYHPPKANYVNMHPYTLHLWRPIEASIPIPHDYLVGMKSAKDADDIIFNSLGMLTPDQQTERVTIANNMMQYGGTFVQHLGDLLQRADANNVRKIKQAWPEYWKEYADEKWNTKQTKEDHE